MADKSLKRFALNNITLQLLNALNIKHKYNKIKYIILQLVYSVNIKRRYKQ